MNENINLCELLKGHEGEIFYSPIFGDATLIEIDNYSKDFSIRTSLANFRSDGRYSINGECLLFPSKNQRDWNKWAKEQKPRIPKTWSQLKECNVEILAIVKEIEKYKPLGESVNKSALALLKIHQLIEVGYGGNITDEEWKNNWHSEIRVDVEGKLFIESTYNSTIFPIAFHTKEQAEEFLSYPDNVQLVKDFYMI